MRCGLTTPSFMQVLPIKRRSTCDIRARYCEALCAAMMTQFLLQLCAHFGSVFRQLRGTVRARVAHAAAPASTGCSYNSGPVGQRMCPAMFERSGAVLWTDPQASVWASVANCRYLRAGCCRTVCMG